MFSLSAIAEERNLSSTNSALPAARAEQVYSEVRRRGGRLYLNLAAYEELANAGLSRFDVEAAVNDLHAAGRVRLRQLLVAVGDGLWDFGVVTTLETAPVSRELLSARRWHLEHLSRRLEREVAELEKRQPSSMLPELRGVLAGVESELESIK